MKPLAYARIAGLAIGVPLAFAFISEGRIPPDPSANAAPPVPEISAGEAGGLSIGPDDKVLELPVPGPGPDTASGLIGVQNKRFDSVRIAVGAAGAGARSKEYEIAITARGESLFRGTPERLRAQGSRFFSLTSGESADVRVKVRPRRRTSEVVDVESFELQWTTKEG